jgi:hypothetical protein
VVASAFLLSTGQRLHNLTDDDKRLISIFDRRDTNVVVMLLFGASGVVLAAGESAGLYLLLPAALVAFISGVLNAWNFLLPPPSTRPDQATGLSQPDPPEAPSGSQQ